MLVFQFSHCQPPPRGMGFTNQVRDLDLEQAGHMVWPDGVVVYGSGVVHQFK